MPQAGDRIRGQATRRGRARKAEPGQRRSYHCERVTRITAVRAGIGKQRQQVKVLTERARPPVGSQQRQRRRPRPGSCTRWITRPSIVARKCACRSSRAWNAPVSNCCRQPAGWSAMAAGLPAPMRCRGQGPGGRPTAACPSHQARWHQTLDASVPQSPATQPHPLVPPSRRRAPICDVTQDDPQVCAATTGNGPASQAVAGNSSSAARRWRKTAISAG